MGYQANFELSLESGENLPKEVVVTIKEEFPWLGGDCYFFQGLAKWYEFDTDMRAFSTRFPDLVFNLHGAGEDSGDIWDYFYKNGKSCGGQAQIVYYEYDEEELR